MSLSVKQCMAVDLFPHILANAVDIQKVHFLLHTPLLNKTPRLFSARMFVRLYRLLLLHCIYVSVTKSTCPAFSAWLNTGAIRSMNVQSRFLSPSGTRFPSHLFSTHFVHIWKASLVFMGKYLLSWVSLRNFETIRGSLMKPK